MLKNEAKVVKTFTAEGLWNKKSWMNNMGPILFE
jgi:hypothetical protein